MSSSKTKIQPQSPIAVIGMSCHYPGASDLKTLWENIVSAKRQFRRFPDQRFSLDSYQDDDRKQLDKTYTTQAGLIEGFEFDWIANRIPKKTIESTDIVHWLTYQVALKAVEDAGYKKGEFPKETTGVILGNTLTGEQTRSSYMRQRWPFVERTLRASATDFNLSEKATDAFIQRTEEYYKSVFPVMTEDSLAGGLSNTIAGRVCNVLDINGGGYTVDGACSSSLIAVATAAEKLSSGALDVVIAGGVDVSLDTFELIGFARTGALTPDEMRVYDKRGNGFVPGEGCGLLILKRLEDAQRDGDKVYAVLQGWGISSDGKGGITAPSGVYQGLALKRAYNLAPYEASDLNFIEGHGTGTTVGDREELKGIALTVGNEPNGELRRCGLTSFKSIVGHTKAAAGAGGLIKAVLAVNQRVIPPTSNCEFPNDYFSTPEGQGIYPILLGQVFPENETLRAGVSAMGFGGINTHITLESGHAPYEHVKSELPIEALLTTTQKTELFPLSAENEQALLQSAQQLKALAFGMSISELPDLASQWSQLQSDSHHCRAVVIVDHPRQLDSHLETLIDYLNQNTVASGTEIELLKKQIWVSNQVDKKRLGFVFPGQGSQQLNMAYRLTRRFSWAQTMLEQANDVLSRQCWKSEEKLGDYVFKPTDRALGQDQLSQWGKELTSTNIAQPAICLASALWLERLKRLGLTPSVVGGHSLGELTAFYAAGAYDFQSLIHLAGVRGHAMHHVQSTGVMSALMCSADQARSLIEKANGYVVVANINHPTQTVISGDKAAVESVNEIARAAGVTAISLPVSNAFHSRLVAAAGELLAQQCPVNGQLRAGVPIVSAMTGDMVQQGESLQQYFSKQVTAPVDFISLTTRLGSACDMVVEVGPGTALSNMVQQTLSDESVLALPVESKALSDNDLNILLAQYHCRGGQVNWSELYESRLIRPFVTAKDKKFIENACEAPFVVTEAEPSLKQIFTEQAVVADVQDITQVGTTNMDKLISSLNEAASTDNNSYDEPCSTQSSESTQSNVLHIEALIIDLVEETTGFPKESLSNDLRLLDDLNLDSIKAAELIGEVVAKLDLQGNIDPAPLANATIKEIAESLNALTTLNVSAMPEAPAIEQQPVVPAVVEVNNTVVEVIAAPVASAAINGVQTNALALNTKKTQAILVNLIEEATGFPASSLEPDLRLLDDLNLDSIKAAELIGSAAMQLELPNELDPAPLANASIAEIATVLTELGGQSDSSNAATTSPVSVSEAAPALTAPAPVAAIATVAPVAAAATTPSISIVEAPALLSPKPAASQSPQIEAVEAPWVRNFVMTPVEQPIAVGSQGELEAGKETVVLCEKAEINIAQAFARQLNQQGVKTKAGTFEAIANNKTCLQDDNVRYIVVVLPRSVQGGTGEENLRRMVNRLHTITGLKSDKKALNVSFVQFAGGDFGVNDVPQSIEQSGTLALASSLHLEKKQLDIRVVDFPAQTDAEIVAEKTIAEMTLSGHFIVAGYTKELKRLVLEPQVHQPATDQSRGIAWSAQDVLLVTGGAKGITAECALAFAKATGVKMALVGSSKAPAPTDQHEINVTLNRFKENGLQAAYYACDLSQAQAVSDCVKRIQAELGGVTGIIHGAAMNTPRPLSYVSADNAYKEVSPKVLGAMHLIQLFEDKPLKLFASLTSIIGVTGMVGNGWYGFSNEVLDTLVGQYVARHPETQAISTAYSVWGEVGMGARMGSTDYLAQMGIMSIPTEEGVNRFVQLLQNNCKARQVVICARLSGLDTWMAPEAQLPVSQRYLEEVVYSYPGVEVISQAHLTLEKDAYVQDHVWKGSYLFPTVFGLEAMAQAVSAVTGVQRFKNLRIEDIKLERPIVVNKTNGLKIQIQARVLEHVSGSNQQRIQVSISTEQSRFRTPHFSALFILDAAQSYLLNTPVGLPEFPEQALNVDPKRDMYSWLLFQGPLFQRISGFYRMDNDFCLFTSKLAENDPNQWVLGSPYLRDSLLQSVQPMVPQHICLPIRIDALNISDSGASQADTIKGIAINNGLEDVEYSTSVYALNEAGQLLESMEGYQLRILEYRSEFPTDKPYAEPKAHEEEALKQALETAKQAFSVQLPNLKLSYIPNISRMDKEQRHDTLKTDIDQWLQESTGESLSVDWQADGKPVVKGNSAQQRSISMSHKHSHVLLASGQGEHGCDVESISDRSSEGWRTLLGTDTQSPESNMQLLLSQGDSMNVAGTRLWSAREAAFKACGDFEQTISIAARQGEAVLFSIKTKLAEFDVLTVPVGLWRGGRKMVATTTLQAVAVSQAGQAIENDEGFRDVLQQSMKSTYNNAPTQSALNNSELLIREELEKVGYQPDHYLIGLRPPQNSKDIPVFVMRTPLYFKDAQMLSRGVFFANYFLWMGKTREAATYPIMSPMAEQLVTGKWGLVTNSASITVYGEASSGDVVETRFWMGRVFDSNDSTFDLFYDWRKLMADGSQVRIAKGVMRASWVRILDHGLVAPEPLPDYFSNFVDQMQPEDGIATPDYEPLHEPLKGQNYGPVLHQAPAGPRCGWPLMEQAMSTSLDDANSVGNVYFSNYSRWQGIVRDQFFFNHGPEFFRGIGEKGELVTTSAHVEHLREAMPFDTILVVMRVSTIAERGAELQFDYFRSNADGTRTKLAVGYQTLIWARKNADGLFESVEWPEIYKTALLNAVPEQQNAPEVEPMQWINGKDAGSGEPLLMMID